MRTTARRTWTVVGCAVMAVGLAACGAQSGSHVVQPPTATTPISPGGAVTGTPTPGASSAGQTVVSDQTLDQLEAELAALDSSLNQANADLQNPQGDS